MKQSDHAKILRIRSSLSRKRFFAHSVGSLTLRGHCYNKKQFSVPPPCLSSYFHSALRLRDAWD